METQVYTAASGYLSALSDLIRVGKHEQGRLGGMREIIGYTLRVDWPDTVRGLYRLEGRNLNPTIGALEALQLLGQVSLPEVHVDRVKAFDKYLNGGVFLGAYGQRVHGQFEKLVNTLAQPGSRQAVLTVFDSRQDLGAISKDIPCTLSLQFFIRSDRVWLRTSMRSNDAWLGLPYDLHQFINLQAAVAAHFGLPMGGYQHTVGSMHLYDRDYDKAFGLIQGQQRTGRLDPVTVTRQSMETQTLFEPASLHELSSWARRCLTGPWTRIEGDETDYQTWMRRSVA